MILKVQMTLLFPLHVPSQNNYHMHINNHMNGRYNVVKKHIHGHFALGTLNSALNNYNGSKGPWNGSNEMDGKQIVRPFQFELECSVN